MWDGGNQWAAWAAWLAWFRHVVQLPLDYSRWQWYEAAVAETGPRIMHPRFCMVSDRPVRLRVDAQSRPHADDGPFCAWSDGAALYAWHGVRVPARVIERPMDLRADEITAEPNAEVRRVMLERYGAARYLLDVGAKRIYQDDTGELYRQELSDDEPLAMVRVLNSTPEPDGTRRPYWLRVPPTCQTAREAVAWTVGKAAAEYRPVAES